MIWAVVGVAVGVVMRVAVGWGKVQCSGCEEARHTPLTLPPAPSHPPTLTCPSSPHLPCSHPHLPRLSTSLSCSSCTRLATSRWPWGRPACASANCGGNEAIMTLINNDVNKEIVTIYNNNKLDMTTLPPLAPAPLPPPCPSPAAASHGAWPPRPCMEGKIRL